MAELISLNRARKRQDKEEKSKRAEMNRFAFGRTKSEREKTVSEAGRILKMLDQHQLPKGDAT